MPENEVEDGVVETPMDEADAGKPVEQSAETASSTVEDVSKPADDGALSIVRDVVAKGKAKSEAAASSATAEAEPETGAKPTKEPKERDDENFSDAPFNKHKRFQELLAQRNEFREDATRYRNVQSFIDNQGMSSQEAADILIIGGLMKTNPVEAWKRMRPVVEQVARAAGEVLSPEIKAMVDEGQMPIEAAREVSRARAAVAAVEAQQRWTQERAQRDEQTAASEALRGAAGSWEQERQVRDPNFASKLEPLKAEVQRLMQSGWRPNTPEGVQAQLNAAYQTVNATFAPPAARLQKPQTKPVTGGQVNGNARPALESTLDVVKNVLAARKAG